MPEPVVQFAFQAPPPGRPSLAQLQVVEKIVDDFSGKVMEIRHAFRTGAPGAQDAVAKIEAAAQAVGKIFIGEDSAYSPAPWNTSARMGAIFRVYGDADEVRKRTDDPGTAFWIGVAKVVTAACVQLERGERPAVEITADLERYLVSVVDKMIGAK